ncbi:unnamed protein product [Cercopithifilaria johnstoni]|uniref:C-type lectin domain-containing protein n=1 Tax=Cercopithifilaria johnstoni TaxID=2874296 RepID=A0A8J2MM72_9BILA|nr:unnamed protein product [Cercopithifilaria johnstoni]
MCEISSNKSCMDMPTVRNATNFMIETLDSKKLINKTDLVEIVAQSTQLKFRNSDNLTSALVRSNLTDSNSFITSGNETSILIVPPNVKVNNLLSELVKLQNMTQNNASESGNTSSSMDDPTKMMQMKVASKIARELDPELKANTTSINCLNHVYRLPEMKSDADETPSMKNVLLVSERSSIKVHLRKFLEIVRDAFSDLLQSFHMTTISGNTTLIGDGVTLGQNSTSHRKALAICSAQDAFLTSITNSDEMEFISELAGNDTYLIGLIKDGNQWYWIDNYTELNYTNWRTLEPNDCCGINVKCVAVNWNGTMDGQWNDVDCENIPPANFVCKKRL